MEGSGGGQPARQAETHLVAPREWTTVADVVHASTVTAPHASFPSVSHLASLLFPSFTPGFPFPCPSRLRAMHGEEPACPLGFPNHPLKAQRVRKSPPEAHFGMTSCIRGDLWAPSLDIWVSPTSYMSTSWGFALWD